MKKVGVAQIVTLRHRPSVYVFDETFFQLYFTDIIPNGALRQVVAEIGKEVTAIKNVRVIAAQGGNDHNKRDLELINSLEQELIELYNNADEYASSIVNGSGTLHFRNTKIKFRKPKVCEIKNPTD